MFGIVVGYTVLSEYAIAQIACDELTNATMTMTLPTHVARRNCISLGDQVKISLWAEAIHLMPYEKLHGEESWHDAD